MAQSSTSGVVGYETLELDGGFNFVGVRLHQAPVASGTLETVNANSVVDNDVDLGALMDGSTFILEIEDGSGIIQEVTTSDGGSGLATADTSGVTAPVSYTLRAADTLASVFGAANESGLAEGTFGSSAIADEVWLWNGSSFDQYYFDNTSPQTFGTEWVNIGTGLEIDANDVDIIYADGFVINSKSGNDVVVTGDLKSTETEIGIVGGFNFIGSVAPVGATLETAFGAANEAGLAEGTFGSSASADEVWIYNGGGFDQYYFDNTSPQTFGTEWVNIGTGLEIDSSTVDLPAGYVINGKGPKAVTQGVPSYYAGL